MLHGIVYALKFFFQRYKTESYKEVEIFLKFTYHLSYIESMISLGYSQECVA